jgi:hypothetical protein
LKIKLKASHFDTIDVIEAESQAMLNTTSRMHLKKGRSTGNGAYERKRTSSKVMVASRPRVSFSQIEVSVPEIMDTPLFDNILLEDQ